MKVASLVASSRKGMNTDTPVTKFSDGAKSVGAETQKIYLNGLQIDQTYSNESFLNKRCSGSRGIRTLDEQVKSLSLYLAELWTRPRAKDSIAWSKFKHFS